MRNRVYSLLLVGAGIAILIASTILFNASVDGTNQADSHTALSEKEKPLYDNTHLVAGLATQRDVTDHAEEQGWYIWIKLDNLIESLHDSSSTWNEICARTSKTELQMWKNNLLDVSLVLPLPTEKYISFVIYTAGCLSDVHFQEGQAIELLQSVIDSGAANTHIHHMLATSYIRLGDDYKAEKVLENILSAENLRLEADNDFFGGSIRAKLAIVKMRLSSERATDKKRLNESVALLQEASNMEGLSEHSPLRHGQLAVAEMALGNYVTAETEYRKALELTDKAENVWDDRMITTMRAEYSMGLGQLLYISGRVDEGTAYMNQAMELIQTSNNQELEEAFKKILLITTHPEDYNISLFGEQKHIHLE